MPRPICESTLVVRLSRPDQRRDRSRPPAGRRCAAWAALRYRLTGTLGRRTRPPGTVRLRVRGCRGYTRPFSCAPPSALRRVRRRSQRAGSLLLGLTSQSAGGVRLPVVSPRREERPRLRGLGSRDALRPRDGSSRCSTSRRRRRSGRTARSAAPRRTRSATRRLRRALPRELQRPVPGRRRHRDAARADGRRTSAASATSRACSGTQTWAAQACSLRGRCFGAHEEVAAWLGLSAAGPAAPPAPITAARAALARAAGDR